MTRRMLLVPLFAAALILAPSEISGKIAASPAPRAGTRPAPTVGLTVTSLWAPRLV
jgi:hypothetical protein